MLTALVTGRHRVAIVGTREPTPAQRAAVVALVNSLPRGTVVVSGGARGVDTIAVDAAFERRLNSVVYPADWEAHGKGAGFIRNQKIVDNCDEVHAFPGAGRGTWDTIAKARKAGKTVTVHE